MEPSAEIDRGSYEPAYAQLVRILRERIAVGEFRPGSRLPSEAQLCDRYGVSPMTVRRAINVLLDQGVVNTIQGSGTFVKAMGLGGVTFSLDELTALFRDRERTRVRLLEARIVSADARTARKLAVAEGARVIYIRRLLSRDEVPVLYHREQLVYDPTRPIVEAEMEATALQGLLAGSGETNLKGGALTIEATTLTGAEADLLGGTAGDPAFRLAHTFYDFDDRAVSWGWFIWRGDSLRFRTTVGIWGRERPGDGRRANK